MFLRTISGGHKKDAFNDLKGTNVKGSFFKKNHALSLKKRISPAFTFKNEGDFTINSTLTLRRENLLQFMRIKIQQELTILSN